MSSLAGPELPGDGTVGISGAKPAGRISRPTVDVVVPFAGTSAQLSALLARLHDLPLCREDTLTVVDNRRDGCVEGGPAREVTPAPAVQSSYYARNRGAERGRGEWIVFIDADVVPHSDFLDAYFDDPVAPDVAVLAGAIHDQEPTGRRDAAARYAFLRQAMHQNTTRAQLGPFAKTANAAVRREAFEQIGGFQDDLLSGGDVDLCYRLRDAGWRFEYRDRAIVEHIGRDTVRELLLQQARHGTGVEWLDGVYPGFSPPFRWSSLIVSLLRGACKAAIARSRGDRDRALIELLDPATALAFHVGRLRRNHVD